MTTERAASKNPRGLEGALRKLALSYPEATEDIPWEHRALKVRGKSFAFLVREKDALVLSVTLPKSGYQALALPFVKPTEYGLGKSGWVTARIPPKAAANGIYGKQCRAWLEESYRAVAPKRVAAQLDAED
jgi:predicted DNA-binding protein (MmcQ/YjbR family)